MDRTFFLCALGLQSRTAFQDERLKTEQAFKLSDQGQDFNEVNNLLKIIPKSQPKNVGTSNVPSVMGIL